MSLDFQFWTTFLVNAIFGLIAAYGVYLQHRQNKAATVPVTGPSHVNKSGASFSKVMWIALIGLAAINWLPLVLSRTSGSTIQTSVRHGGGQSMDAFQQDLQRLGQEVGVTRMNLGVYNYGPLPAKDVSFKARIFWSRDLRPTEEDDEWKTFAKQSFGEPTDLDVGSAVWSTFESAPLKESDLLDIKASRLKLYTFLAWAYTDGGGKHATEECRSLQTPILPNGLVWQSCRRGQTKIK